MRYLVTGGAGFIGSHLIEALLNREDSVTLLDNLSTGQAQNLNSLESSSKLEFIFGDIQDIKLVSDLVSKCDRVIHLAAAVGVANIMRNTAESMETNISGTNAVFKACVAHKRPVLFASSSEIYGKNFSGPLKEDDDRIVGPPQNIRWSYSDSKAIDEALAFTLHQQVGLEVRVVRLFNTVGPRQRGDYGMVLPRFIGWALRNESIQIYGDGTQTRCFAHVDDVVDAIIRVDSCTDANGTPINIGVNQEISMTDLAKLVIEITNSNSPIVYRPYHEIYSSGFEDMVRRVPDTTRLTSLTGWTSKKSIRNIISDILETYS